MSIEKIRHGAEITSSKLNDIIEEVNKTSNDHKDIRDLSATVEKTIATVYNKLEEYSEQVGEHLDSIPEIKNLYSDILLARDSVDWIEISDSQTDISAQIATALSGYSEENEEPAQRLRIIRGPKDKIETVEKKDKQILIGYELDEERNVLNGILYFDYYDSKSGSLQRCPVSSSRDTTITISAPELSFFTTLEGEVKLQASYNGTVQSISPNLKGEDGASGIQGPKGEKGDKGDPGNDGAKGDRGPQGEDGPATLISVMYSQYSTGLNPSDTYQESKHKYMGIRSYLSSMTVDEVKSQPIKWFRITGDTLYPVYDKDTGCLTFTTTLPDEPLNFYIKGEQGPKGDKGEAPSLAFKVIKDGKEILQPIAYIDANGNQVYDLTALKGEKGESIKFSELTAEEKEYLRGEKGDKGDKPTISFMVEHTDKEYPSIKDTTPIGSPFDAVFTISIPKAKDGTDGENGTDGAPGQDGKDGYSIVDLSIDSATGNGTVILARDVIAYENKEDTPTRTIPLGKITGDKGDDGVGISEIKLVEELNNKRVYSIVLTNGKENLFTITNGIDGINGEQGSQGEKGEQGERGERGEKGEQGDRGEPGPQGPQGVQGPPGKDGKSLTFSDLTDSQKEELRGEQGLQGKEGPKGDPGTSLNISGAIYSVSTLPAISSVAENSAFVVKTATSYDLYFKGKDSQTWAIIEDWGGVKGDPGKNANITECTVSMLEAGSTPSVTISGDIENRKIAFKLPKGDKGDPGDKGEPLTFSDLTQEQKLELKGEKGEPGQEGPTGKDGTAATINIGSVYTGNPGTQATVTNRGTNTAAILDITIPQGAKGDPGKDLTFNDLTVAQKNELKGDKGDPGTDGKDGNKLLTGTEVTSTSATSTISTAALSETLSVGDLYLNSSTYNLYKVSAVNSNNTYTLLLLGTIKGPKGDQGVQGPKGDTGKTGSNGQDGTDGRGIDTVTYVGLSSDSDGRNVKTYQINFTDNKDPVQFSLTDGKDGTNGVSVTHSWNGTELTLDSASGRTTTNLKGEKGDTGIGITSVTKTSTSGNIDTYTITYSNNTNSTFTITNGIDGAVGNKGEDGKDGYSIHITTDATPPTTHDIGSVKVGDLIITGKGEIYTIASVNGTTVTYEDAFITIKGDKGDKGDQGPVGYYTKATKVTNSLQAISLTMEQSVYYELTNANITAISLTLGEVSEDTVGEFICEFTTSSSIPVITLPTNVSYANGWTQEDYEPNTRYIIYILNTTAFVSWT